LGTVTDEERKREREKTRQNIYWTLALFRKHLKKKKKTR
jgi:hypothetical protein